MHSKFQAKDSYEQSGTHVVRNEGDAEGPKSLSGYLEVFSHSATTKVRITTVVAYHVHVLIMASSAQYCTCVIENGHTAVGFLTLIISKDLKASCSICKGCSSVYCFTGTGEFHEVENGDSPHR